MEIEEVLIDKKPKFQLKKDKDYYTVLEQDVNNKNKFNLIFYYKDIVQWRNIVTSYQEAYKKSEELLTKLYFHNVNKKQMVKESPDGVKVGKKMFMWFDNQAYGFNYDTIGNLMVTPKGKSHYSSFDLGREQMVNAGRVWLNDKILSFWEYPSNDKLNNIIKDLETYFKISIDKNEWMIEIVTDSNDKIISKPYSGKMWDVEAHKLITLTQYSYYTPSSNIRKRSVEYQLEYEKLITKFSIFKMKD